MDGVSIRPYNRTKVGGLRPTQPRMPRRGDMSERKEGSGLSTISILHFCVCEISFRAGYIRYGMWKDEKSDKPLSN